MARAALIVLRVFATPLLVLLIGAAFISCVAVDAAENHLLSADFYLDAMDENDAYARILDEFLLEVEQADTTQDLVAHTDTTAGELSALVREIVQVSWLRAQFESNVRSLFSYVRGDTDELTLLVEVGPVLERMPAALSAFVMNRLATAPTQPVESYEEFRSGVDGTMQLIASGHEVPVLPTYELTEAEREEVLSLIFAPGGLLEGSSAREEVDAALQHQDTAGALMAVANELIATRLDDATAQLREKLDDDERLDIVAQIAEDEGKSREEVVDELDSVRQVISLVTHRGRAAAGLLVLLFAGLLGITYLPGRARPLLVPGAVLIGWAALGLVWWSFNRGTVPGWFRDRVLENDTKLSDSGVRLVADMAETLARDSSDAALRVSLVMLTAGVAVVIAGAVRHYRSQGPNSGSGTQSPV